MTSLKSGVYWRKSKIFGHLCPPGILALEGDVVSFTTSTEHVFRAAASDIEANFTGWGTLVLRVDGRTFDMIGSGGEMAAAFSKQQIAELKQSTIDRGGVAGTAGDLLAASGNAAAAVLGELITVGVATGKYASGVKILKQWPLVLAEAGAQVKATKSNYMGWLYGAVGVVLVALLIVGLALQNR
ncbi:MAG: hypothetical protein ACOH1T_03810 [Microbacteriaceae bacterium]